MKSAIEKRLNSIIGKRFSKTTRTLNLECLQFGELTINGDREVGEEAIHINCDWRIVGKTLYIGSKDINFNKDGGYDRDIDWDFETFRDVEMRELLKRNNLTVQSISADNFGGFEIEFDKSIYLQVIPMTSSKDWVNEYWRILKPGDNITEHFVVTSRDIQ